MPEHTEDFLPIVCFHRQQLRDYLARRGRSRIDRGRQHKLQGQAIAIAKQCIHTPQTPRRPLYRVRQPYVPRVRIKSSQQLSLSTFIFHVSPDLSCAVAEVPVVMILCGRELGSDWVGGGCSILSIGAIAL
jgi:hypothetical protein